VQVFLGRLNGRIIGLRHCERFGPTYINGECGGRLLGRSASCQSSAPHIRGRA